MFAAARNVLVNRSGRVGTHHLKATELSVRNESRSPRASVDLSVFRPREAANPTCRLIVWRERFFFSGYSLPCKSESVSLVAQGIIYELSKLM
jgi:hypothetical protein